MDSPQRPQLLNIVLIDAPDSRDVTGTEDMEPPLEALEMVTQAINKQGIAECNVKSEHWLPSSDGLIGSQ